ACPSDALPSPPTISATSLKIYGGLTSYMPNWGVGPYTYDPNPDPNLGQDGIFLSSGSKRVVSMVSITDGTSNTLLFGERYSTDPLWSTYATTFGSIATVPFYGYFSYSMANNANLWPLGLGAYPLNKLFPACPSSGCQVSDLFDRIFTYGSGH